MKEAKWYIDNKLKPPKAFFDWCYSQIHTYKWSNKNETILASDREGCKVIEKRLTKKTKLTFFDKFYTFAIVLVTSKRIEIQSYAFFSSIKDGKQEIEMHLSNFEQFANDKHVKATSDGKSYWLGLTRNYGSMSGPYHRTQFYENGWREKVKQTSELRYLKFKKEIEGIWELDNLYRYRLEIEFLQKINAMRLADEVMYPSYRYGNGYRYGKTVDMRILNEKWLRENKQYFKNSDRGFMEFELERRIKQRNGKVVPGIERYLYYSDIAKIPKGVGIIRFQNWMIKNDINFDYYLDYIGMLKDLSIDPTNNENLIIPKDLTKAHENAVRLLNILHEEKLKAKEEQQRRMDAEKESEYQKTLDNRIKLETVISGLAFILPRELNELIVEGKTLHHCVGSSTYVDQHRKGKTTIVFIRKVNSPKEPYYTLEYNRESIKQIRGKHNQSAPDEVWKAAESWLEWVVGGCKEKRKVS